MIIESFPVVLTKVGGPGPGGKPDQRSVGGSFHHGSASSRLIDQLHGFGQIFIDPSHFLRYYMTDKEDGPRVES